MPITQRGGRGLLAALGKRAAPLQGPMVVRVSRSNRRMRPSQTVSTDSNSASVAAPDSAAADSTSAASTRRRCASATGLSVTPSILLELMFER
jgi:hypothetical protein